MSRFSFSSIGPSDYPKKCIIIRMKFKKGQSSEVLEFCSEHQMFISFGTMGVLRIGVLGAGIAGTTTALELQSIFRNAHIVVCADRFFEETTSNGAAGIFRPGTSFSGPDHQTTTQWINYSFEFYNSLVGKGCGVEVISGYIFSSFNPEVVRNHFLENLVPVYRSATPSELSYCPGNWKYGSFFQTLLIESHTFLPWALRRFKENGGKIEKKTVQDFKELEDKFDIVVNCTGLGAKWLCQDHKLVPIRGQVLKVEAPWLGQFFYGDFDTYIIPGSGGIATLGGSRHYDSFRTEPCSHDGASIHERCVKMVPRLVTAPVVRTWVGLRPHRDPVRVQAEILPNLKVVHNYGHGGYGITSAPGTSNQAARLVSEIHSSRSKL